MASVTNALLDQRWTPRGPDRGEANTRNPFDNGGASGAMQAKNESIFESVDVVVGLRLPESDPDGQTSHRIEINPPKTVQLTRGIDIDLIAQDTHLAGVVTG